MVTSKTEALFIDDERDPPSDDKHWWRVIRSFGEMVNVYMNFKEFHPYISFDHDLGKGQSGLEIVKWMIHMDQRGFVKFPPNFKFTVHSQNPVGKANIEGLLNSYLTFKELYSKD
jgi:hypothetical protein